MEAANKFFVKKSPDENGYYDIFVEGGSEMIRVSSVMRLDLDQVRASIWACSGLPEKSISYFDQDETYEIYEVNHEGS